MGRLHSSPPPVEERSRLYLQDPVTKQIDRFVMDDDFYAGAPSGRMVRPSEVNHSGVLMDLWKDALPDTLSRLELLEKSTGVTKSPPQRGGFGRRIL